VEALGNLAQELNQITTELVDSHHETSQGQAQSKSKKAKAAQAEIKMPLQ
jgi:hypothetical protein